MASEQGGRPSEALWLSAGAELQRSLAKLFALGPYAAMPGVLRDAVSVGR